MQVELSSCFWIPRKWFDAAMRKQFTVKVELLTGETETVEAFREDRPGYIGLPRVAGLQTFATTRYADLRATRPVRFPKQVKLFDEQIPVVEQAIAACRTHTDFLLRAATGKGKTVMGLAIAARLGQATVVVVDQELLMDQWIERAKTHLGLREDQIGIVRGKKMDYKGKPLTICMMQTLTRKETLPEEFCTYFGLAIFDEFQVAGASTFSRMLMVFSASNKLGLSATPRKDAKQKLITWGLGSIAAQLLATPEASNVYVIEHETVYSWQANAAKMTGRYIAEVTEDGHRNLCLAQAIHWLYESGRDILVISDRIEQLQGLMALCGYLGVPVSDMRMCAKSRMVWQYEKDPTPLRRPAHLERGAEYTPVRLSWVQKTIPKKILDEAKENGRVLFSTYGIMAKGVDIPRLSAGVDASPRSDATQVIGRILRLLQGKLRSIWVTVADINSYRSLHQLGRRLQDYQTSNAEVFLWDQSKGRKRLDYRAYRRDLQDRVDELKECRIITSLDGLNTLLPPTPSGKSRGIDTGRRAR